MFKKINKKKNFSKLRYKEKKKKNFYLRKKYLHTVMYFIIIDGINVIVGIVDVVDVAVENDDPSCTGDGEGIVGEDLSFVRFNQYLFVWNVYYKIFFFFNLIFFLIFKNFIKKTFLFIFLLFILLFFVLFFIFIIFIF